jgi:hypothetical protein
MSEVASWVEAIGTVGAVVSAIALWRVDREANRQSEIRADREHMRRMVAGLRAEVRAALEAADTRRTATEGIVAPGATVINQPPPPIGSLAITSGIVYRQVAAEMGKLPPSMIQHVVSFYERAQELERVAGAGSTAADAFSTVHSLVPRLAMFGAMLISLLDKFEAAGFDPDARLEFSHEELQAMSRRTSYPLDEVIRNATVRP